MLNLFSVNSPLWRFMDRLLHLLWLNLLWLLCCLPVLTIGAATTALYTVTLKYARDQEGYMTREFFLAFKANFLQSTKAALILAAAGILLGLDFIVYARHVSAGPLSMILLTAFFTCGLLYLFLNLYIYAIMAKFQNTLAQCFKNALIMSVCHWPSSIFMLVLGFAILAVGLLLFPPLLFMGFALFSCVCSRFLLKIFDCYITEPETGLSSERSFKTT